MILILTLDELGLPYYVTFSMTNDCNLACPYCYVQKAKTYMSFEVGKKAIDYCYKNLLIIKDKYKNIQSKIANSDQLKCGMHFFGGEPLLNWSVLKELVEYAELTYPNDWTYGITTNGTLLTEEMCQFFQEHKFSICLSCDGIKEDQDKQRPFKSSTKSTYDVLLNKIKILSKYKPYDNLVLRATITQNNISHFYQMYKLFESFNFTGFLFDFDYFVPWTEELLLPFKIELEKVIRDRALTYLNNQQPIIDFPFSTSLLKEYFKGQLEILLGIPIYINKNEPFVYTNCGYGLESIIINGKGNLYPCHEEPDFIQGKYSNIIGNIDTGIDLVHLEELRENIKNVEQKFLDTRNCYNDCIIKQNHMQCAYTSCPANLFQLQKVTTYNCIIKKWCLELVLKYSYQLYLQNNEKFLQLLNTFPSFQVYQDILMQPEGPIRDFYIQKYKNDLIYQEQE